MRVSKGPPQWDIYDSIWHKCRAVVPAVCRADLQRNPARPGQLGQRVDVRRRRNRRGVERPRDRTLAEACDGEVLQLEGRIGGHECVDRVAPRRGWPGPARGRLGALEPDLFARTEEGDGRVLEPST